MKEVLETVFTHVLELLNLLKKASMVEKRKRDKAR